MKVGDRVRVRTSVIVSHHPSHRNRSFDLNGHRGEVIAIIEDWQGRPVSASYPIHVRFDKKFTAHFVESELELVVP